MPYVLESRGKNRYVSTKFRWKSKLPVQLQKPGQGGQKRISIFLEVALVSQPYFTSSNHIFVRIQAITIFTPLLVIHDF